MLAAEALFAFQVGESTGEARVREPTERALIGALLRNEDITNLRTILKGLSAKRR